MKTNSSLPGSTSTFTHPVPFPCEIRSYSELQQQIHNDLRAQHPEWVEPNGESPICDVYEARLAHLLDSYAPTESDESIAAVSRALKRQTISNDLALSPSKVNSSLYTT